MEVDDPGTVQAVDLAQCGQEDVEAFPVVVGPEIGQPGLGRGFGVQRFGIQRALGGHRRHQVADLVDLRAEARLGQVIEVYRNGSGVGHGDLCYFEFRNDDRAWPPPR